MDALALAAESGHMRRLTKDDMERARIAAAAVLGVSPEGIEVRQVGGGKTGRPPRVSDETLVGTVEAAGSVAAAARQLGISARVAQQRMAALRAAPRSRKR